MPAVWIVVTAAVAVVVILMLSAITIPLLMSLALADCPYRWLSRSRWIEVAPAGCGGVCPMCVGSAVMSLQLLIAVKDKPEAE